jgi:O-antigen/teichoic acid export membrane protein
MFDLLPRRICHRILESPVSLKRLSQLFPVFLILVGAALLFERPAYAYADPGTGLLAVQAAGSALVATGWYLRRKIYSLFHSSDAPAPESDKQSAVADGEDLPNL